MLQILTLTNHKVFCTIQNINIERLHMNTLNISSELAHEIIRSKYNLPDNFRIVIDPPTHVEENKSDEWIYVPNNWYNRYMPPEATNSRIFWLNMFQAQFVYHHLLIGIAVGIKLSQNISFDFVPLIKMNNQ